MSNFQRRDRLLTLIITASFSLAVGILVGALLRWLS